MALKTPPIDPSAVIMLAELIDRTLLGFMTVFSGQLVAQGLGLVLGGIARSCPTMRADIAFGEHCARNVSDDTRGSLKAALTNEGRREDESIN